MLGDLIIVREQSHWTQTEDHMMANECTEDEAKVEYFETASGSYMKYDFVVMRNPNILLQDDAKEYLRWLRQLEECASEAGLRRVFEGKALRSWVPGESQNNSDMRQAALNHFVLESIAAHARSFDKDTWRNDTRNTQDFSSTATPTLLERIKEKFLRNDLVATFGMSLPSKYTTAEAIGSLNYEWDNLKEVEGEVPDGLYLCAAWSFGITFDLESIRDIFAESFPRMPCITAVKAVLEEHLD